MPTPPSAERASLGLSVSVVPFPQASGEVDYEAHIRFAPPLPRATEWLIITPRNPMHPKYQPRHWLSDPLDGWHGSLDELPTVIRCPLDVTGLNPTIEVRATVYAALRTSPDAVTVEPISVVITPARLAAADSDLDALVTGLGTAIAPATSSPASAAPGPLAAQPRHLEPFCGSCGRRFVGAEKFCPDDGRQRQLRKGT